MRITFILFLLCELLFKLLEKFFHRKWFFKKCESAV
ncbi:hypothetical protein CF65_02869 [Aggregatibacter actinomycetemcomitans HK1651]|nr:hypothetical protein CF65_02869 [Aggregatibacter actinomycetemcomitans HK1651]